MIKKTITYKNYNDEEITEDFYFHISKAELIELEASEDGGLSEMLKKIMKTQDGAKILSTFKDLVAKAYGVKSEDGRRFIKNDEVRADFLETEAYSELFMELATDADKASEFVSGILPSGIDQEAIKIQAEAEARGLIEPKNEPDVTSDGDGSDDVDVEALLAEMPEDKSEKPAGKPISRQQAEFLKSKLSEKQFEQHMANRYIVD